jgi:serine protease Do
MRRIVLALVVVAAAAYAQSNKEKIRRALVRLQVTDDAFHKAVALQRAGAPIDALRKIRIRQGFELLLSGVVISPRGEIVTTALHPNAELRVLVTFHDGSEHRARVLGTDPLSNLALVQVPAQTKDYLEIREGAVVLREEVSLEGYSREEPVRVEGAVARKAVSATVHDIYRLQRGEPLRIGQVFWVAAPVARTNPGSACVDKEGKLAGLTVGVMPPLVATRDAYEVTFVIPTARISRVVGNLREHGRVIRAHYGFYAIPATRILHKHFDLPDSACSVVKVERNTPAARAGIRQNDLILTVDGESFADACALGEALTGKPPNTPVRLQVLRKGRKVDLTCTPEDR